MKTMLIDMHIHTDSHSLCSIIDPVDMVRRAEEQNLSGIVITEHDYVWTEGEIEALKRETGTDLLIMRGQEVSSTMGHLLVYGYYDRFDCVSPEEIIYKTHQSNGVVLVSHPFRYGDYEGHSLSELKEEFARFDGIEALNGNQSKRQNMYGLNMCETLGMNGIGGSDAHSLERVGRYATAFEADIRCEADLIDQIRAGRCRPVSGNGYF